ncbi:MAG: MBL fold metallo-hydrolase [Bacteroidales bacterium]|jgi:glyoxylase-like metal-dependent hydrolase (beta-lactamase superfamily II)|nr:MBL fold metallo-hydrolase [Bacteroidales bacterium]
MRTWKTKSGYKIIQVLAGRSNVFLLSDRTKHILIDTSAGFMYRVLKKRLERMNISQIDLLILTHTHFDHAANANRIKNDFNARVLVHQDEAAFLRKGDMAVHKGTNRFTRLIIKLFSKRFIKFTGYEPCSADLIVDLTLSLSEIGFNAFILHTPGHTSGSVSVIIDDEIALVGDTMFGIFPWTVYPPFANDPSMLIESWGKLLQTGCTVFIPSHGRANIRKLVQRDFEARKEDRRGPDNS